MHESAISGRDASLFHGFIAVAPLKRCIAGVRRDRHRLFHGFIAVAPLKLLSL